MKTSFSLPVGVRGGDSEKGSRVKTASPLEALGGDSDLQNGRV